MKGLLCLFVAAFVIVIAASDGYSQQRKGGINKRQVNQQKRIYNGIQSGKLTKRETYGLERQQRHINNVEDRYRTSGDGLSLKERARLTNMQDRASRSIYRQKHDDQNNSVPRIP